MTGGGIAEYESTPRIGIPEIPVTRDGSGIFYSIGCQESHAKADCYRLEISIFVSMQ
jgi:hypothetical protein